MMAGKILEICEFSSGIGGVSARVFQESHEFIKKGFQVTIFSSDIEEGTGKKAKNEEKINKINIRRFPASNSFFSKNVNYFAFNKEFSALNPDFVIVHTIHPHSFQALKLCLKYKTPCYLVTHSPFNVKRNFILSVLTKLYYFFKVKPLLNKFTKVISITRWEQEYLEKLGIKKEKITYIPNGIPIEFFSKKKIKPEKKVLFLGRIAPVKNLETLILAASILPSINFDIVGMAEEEYLERLQNLIKNENIKNVNFISPVFDLKKKIELIDKHSVFVLPSKREAMPQVLLEAQARGKVVISSNTDGGKELIDNKKTGFLFKIGDYKELSRLITENISGDKKITKNAEKVSSAFSWKELIKKYLVLFNS